MPSLDADTQLHKRLYPSVTLELKMQKMCINELKIFVSSKATVANNKVITVYSTILGRLRAIWEMMELA